MFSYRHAFHAGNHADVLKHFVQVQLHQYMNQKDTAYTYIDTHSGAGVYALDSAQALKSGEYVDGIARLWERDDLPPALAEYVDLVRKLNPSGKLRWYPGSPWVAEEASRPQDRLRLFELHPADSKVLADNIRKLEAHQAEQGERARGRRIIVERSDGFQSMKALLPPPSRRALVLVDPPYEVKLDYKHVRDALEDALGRFPSGTFAVWYPVLQRMESRQFPDRLKRLPAKEWLHVSLSVAGPRPDGNGLHSSAMFILNPPYTLEPVLREVLPYLVQVLGQDSGASFRIERGTQLTGALAGRTGTTGAARQPVGNARRASPLSGAGSLRLPGQAYGDGPRARGTGQGDADETGKRAGAQRVRDGERGMGGTGGTSARRTGTERAGATRDDTGSSSGRGDSGRNHTGRNDTGRSGTSRGAGGRPDAERADAPRGTQGAGTARGATSTGRAEPARRPVKRRGPPRS